MRIKKNKLPLVILVLILIALPLILISIKQTLDTRSSAAEPDKLEAEGGTLSTSGATKQADSSASEGNFVQFANTISPTPTLAPNAYFVSNSGNDTNTGTQASPWKTIQKAANTVPAGATVYLRSGAYDNFTMTRSGTSTSPITFTSYPGEKATVTGINMPRTSEGFGTTNDYVIKINGADYITVSNLIIEEGRGIKNDHQGGGIQVYNNADNVKILNNLIKNNIAYGVRSYNAANLLIDGNEITQNAAGIDLNQNATGTIISNNLIHTQNKMVTNTVGGNDDTGAQGVGFVKTRGKVIAKNNKLWNNRAPSYDYVYDGGAFEIFGASDVEIVDNIMWDNENILETGTNFADTNEDIKGCNRNIFARNLAYNTKASSTADADRMLGIILRCARDNIVANNTIIKPGPWAFDINRNSADFSGYVDRLKILNNVVVMDEGKIFGITACTGCETVSINYNLFYNPGGNLASTPQGSTTSFTTLKSWGYNINGLNSAPNFKDESNNDYSLTPTSPGISAGTPISGITSETNPNMGYK